MAITGQDQFLPQDMDETMGFGASPGGDVESQMNGGYQQQQQQQQQQQYQQQQQQKQTAGGGGGGTNGVIIQDSSELNETQKLQLAERANEIYRQQLKYMQDHLASLRSLIQDKENIIENLMLRYDLGIITQDQNRQGGNLSPDEIEMEELRRKAEALAQRTILENFELREMVNELRDENFHLRNEIYELQDKINRQVLQINKLEKNAQQNQNMNAQSNEMGTGMDPNANLYGMDEENEDDDNDIYGDVEEDENGDDGQYMDDGPQSSNNTRSHDRGSSITGADWLENEPSDRLTGRRESRTMDHPANSDEARQKRVERAIKHERKESVKPPDLFADSQSDPDEEYMDDEAQRKHDERQNKARKESIATPDIYGDQQGASEDDQDDEDESDNDDDGDDDDDDDRKQESSSSQGTKRRGSQIYMDESALAKRAEREKKAHRRDSSIATPNIFADRYDPVKIAQDKAKRDSPEAIHKRLTRKTKRVANAAVKYVKSHRRKESLAEKLLLGPIDVDDDDLDLKTADPEQRKELQAKARKEQRRKSRQLIKSQVGAKEHFSDDDVELQEDKPQRTGLKTRKKSSQRGGNKPQEDEMPQVTNNKKRRSMKADPIISNIASEETSTRHRRDSSTPIVSLGFEDPDVLLHYEKLKVQDLEKELETKLNELDTVKKERDDIRIRIENEFKTKNESELLKVKETSEIVGRHLDDAIESKAKLAQKCAVEIMRLTMILNTLQQMPKFKSTVQLLIDESMKESNKNGR